MTTTPGLGVTGGITGRVTTFNTTIGIANANVWIVNPHNTGQYFWQVKTNAQGYFQLTNVNNTYVDAGWLAANPGFTPPGYSMTGPGYYAMYKAYCNDSTWGDGYSNNFSVEVNSNAWAAIIINPIPARIKIGVENTGIVADGQDKVRVWAYVTDALNNPVADNTPIQFRFSNVTFQSYNSYVGNWSVGGTRVDQANTTVVGTVGGYANLTYGWIPEGFEGNNTTLTAAYERNLNIKDSVTVSFKCGTDKIVVMEIGDAYSYDPGYAYDTSAYQIIQNVYETLLYYQGSDTTTPCGVLATAWNVSADGLTYTFYLRNGVRFHDGTAFNASAVKYSFDRGVLMNNVDGAWVGAGLTSLLKGGYTWFASSHSPADVNAYLALDTVHVVNDTCVQIRLERPYGGFLYALTFPATSIISPAYDKLHGGYQPGQPDTWMDTHACGTGPYMLEEYQPATMVRLTRFEDYWNGRALTREVLIQCVPDQTQRIAAVNASLADIIYMTPSRYNPADYNSKVTAIRVPSMITQFIGFNSNRAPFNDLRVRQAFAESFNYTGYLDTVTGTVGHRLNGPLPSPMEGYNPAIPACPFDPVHARQLLVDAGFSASNPQTFDFFYNTGNTNRQLALEMLRDQVESYNLGITVNVQALGWATLLDRMHSGNFHGATSSWQADYPAADDTLSAFVNYFGSQFSYNNATIKTKCDGLVAERDPAARQQLCDQIVAGMNRDNAFIWTHTTDNIWPQNKNLQGYVYNPMDYGPRFYGMYKTASQTPEPVETSYDLDLIQGWNLLSVPLWMSNNSITNVIPPEAMANITIIWHYNNSNLNSPVWQFYKPGRTVNTLTNLTDGMGFWVLAKQGMKITVSGSTPLRNNATFNKGWNMVGPEGLSVYTPAEQYGSYYLTWGYENGWYYYKPTRTVNTLTEIKPGKGYWVLVV